MVGVHPPDNPSYDASNVKACLWQHGQHSQDVLHPHRNGTELAVNMGHILRQHCGLVPQSERQTAAHTYVEGDDFMAQHTHTTDDETRH
jgi:hypothetical protein